MGQGKTQNCISVSVRKQHRGRDLSVCVLTRAKKEASDQGKITTEREQGVCVDGWLVVSKVL